jgi:hypothetical protein
MTNGIIANGDTADEIIAARDIARQVLAELELELQEEIDEIRFAALQRGQPMSDDEKALRDERRANLAEARATFRNLNFITLQRLDQSDEVRQLQQRMNEINQEIGDDLERLKKIKRYAETAAKIADAVAKATEKLAQLAARVSAGGM